ncbi:hypothetical protein ABW21_db0206646 [Orbilia brochopaga]|nr:hypothetical protein ABW21_db0206646 [Drechslerella brochopaga]
MTAMNRLPIVPARNPASVTPPFVPGGTIRERLYISRGGERERMPSSEERVSDNTAAYCLSDIHQHILHPHTFPYARIPYTRTHAHAHIQIYTRTMRTYTHSRMA